MNLIDRLLEYDEELEGEISQAIKDEKFKPILKDGEWIGFLTWNEVWKNNKKHIFIRNMYIEPKYRKLTNLLFLRTFFRTIYGHNFAFVFWHNKKRDAFFYAH